MSKNQDALQMLEALNKAVEIAGGNKELAKKIGLSENSSHVGVWRTRDKKASASYVAKISEVTGVPCHELRPDIFPAPANDATNSPNIA